MFAGACLMREQVPPRRWFGAGLAAIGLVWLLWPDHSAAGRDVGPWPILAMTAAAVGWGIYSLAGRNGGDPLAATAANFLLAAPAAVGLLLFVQAAVSPSLFGIALALVSGIVTSGFGYAIWYHVLPQLGAARAGVAQLTVPVVAVAGGMVFLGEPLTLRYLVAATLVLGGVAVAVLPGRVSRRR
jgi:drug/metabolite transporter (DMT)-like permease